MFRKLMYILFTLFVAANLAAQENYVIDSVCVGASRTYRIDGEKGSTYEWHLKDLAGNEHSITNSTGTPFKDIISPGDTVWGSEIDIDWNVIGKYTLSTYQFSIHGCDTLEHGEIKVFDLPVANAGDDFIDCRKETFTLTTDAALNYSSILWKTTGDGTFNFDDQLHPTYYLGKNDSLTGSVNLILIANGLALNSTCTPATDTIFIHINGPVLNFTSTDLLCYNNSSGTIKVNVTDFIPPYVCEWSGPDGFTSSQDSIYNLTAGKYFVTITDGGGCAAKDSIEINQPDELLAGITSNLNKICESDTIRLQGMPSGGTGSYSHLWSGSGAMYLNSTTISEPKFRDAPAGNYKLVYTVEDENGCTKSDNINIDVLPILPTTVTTTICSNELPYNWNGKVLDTSGIYKDTLTTVAGCDSIVTLTLEVAPEYRDTIPMTVCINQLPLNWNGMQINSDGYFKYASTSIAGCDSIVTLNLEVVPELRDTVSMTICNNQLPLNWNGMQINADGYYEYASTSIAGCDSIVTLNLETVPEIRDTIPITICENELPVTLYGQTFNFADTISLVITSTNGSCDTLRTIQLSATPEVYADISISTYNTLVPEGEPLTFTASPSNGGNNPVYAWYVNGIEVSGEVFSTFTYFPQDGDEIYASLISDLECAVPDKAISNIVMLSVIQQSNELTVSQIAGPANCYGESSGYIELSVSGGTPPYNFMWDVGTTDQNRYNLPAGNYTVTITDSDSNSKTRQIAISEPAQLILAAAIVNNVQEPGIGRINLNIMGGTGPYTFQWTGPNGFTSTDEDLNYLDDGDYTVIVTDAHNCIQTGTYSLKSVGSPNILTCAPDDNSYKCEKDVHPVYTYFREFTAAGGFAYSSCGIDTSTFAGVEISASGTCPTYITRQYSVQDSCGNNLSCTRTIVVNDDIPPAITCPSDGSAECISDLPPAYANLGEFLTAGGTISDNCSLDSSSFKLLSADTTQTNSQTNVIRWYSIQDACGNLSYCQQLFKIEDIIPPNAVCNSITVYLDETGKLTLSDAELSAISAGSTDNCTAPEDLIITTNVSSFNCTQVDNVQIINVMVTDQAGNQSVCSANVTVKDTIPPSALCRDAVVYLDSNGNVSIDVSMIDNHSFDNCEIDTMFISQNSFNCTDVGDNLITLTVIDKNSNRSECTAKVTVEDNIAPVVACKNTSFQLDKNAYYKLEYSEILDNSIDECGIDYYKLSQDEFGCEDIGITQITLTAVDYSGNESSCTAEVTIYGNIAPIAQNDTVYMASNTSMEIDVARNDYDVKTNIITTSVSTTTNPKWGVAEVDRATGLITYTPERDFVGTDAMVYSICDDGIPCDPMCAKAAVIIYVQNQNLPPVAENDNFVATCFELTENLMKNDHDPDSNIFYADVIPVEEPGHGSVTIDPSGVFTYLPDLNFYGVDSFIYRICDIGIPSLCDTATVYINVLQDTDCDGIPDFDDIDDDNDGILDVVEGDRTIDTDGDGIYDSLDIDSDNDGIPDNIEGQGEHTYIPPTGIDSDNDGWDDAYDPDSGGDEFTPVDTDGNTVPDYLDTDSDGDGVWDYIEGHDANADGIPDVIRIFTDSDNDGLDDAFDTFDDNGQLPSSPNNEMGSNAPLQDFDLDGIRDWRDVNDDGDEFQTIDEDWNNDGDYSNDDMDLDGHPDYLDIETDCSLFIPEGFSPNGDGVHDFFQIFCIQRYPDAHLLIFNRAGNKLYEKEHYGNLNYWGSDENAWWWGTSENKWTLGGSTLPAGNYVYILELGTGETRKGTVMISY